MEEVYRRVTDHLRILKIRTEDRQFQEFETTDEHPFWSVDREEWIEAGNLKLGERLAGPNGEIHYLVLSLREEHPEGIPVYNFKVADAHTYFVSAPNAPDGMPVLVHNADYDVQLPRKARAQAHKNTLWGERVILIESIQIGYL
ncbi:hypothetical protein V22_32670 [Calycomorphotria hydatis]|uniref:Intein C-terminal splicing domain-containing protein n=1 Tax=Calycomorphotria hydatis TaxID=2528027 RepID=A0A517TCA6_9PLAN|nr:hypothetical protein V22_32670 [Calycomorphotria hydatis]